MNEKLSKKIESTKNLIEYLKQTEMDCLRDVMKKCTDGTYFFDCEEGFPPYCSGVTRHIDDPIDFRIEKVTIDDNDEVQIFGSPVFGEEYWNQENVTHKLFAGQVIEVASKIFDDYCMQQDTLQV